MIRGERLPGIASIAPTMLSDVLREHRAQAFEFSSDLEVQPVPDVPSIREGATILACHSVECPREAWRSRIRQTPFELFGPRVIRK